MKASTQQIIPIVAMLTVVMIGFQNCGPTRFTQDGGSVSMKSLDATDVIVPTGDISEPEMPVADNDSEVPMIPEEPKTPEQPKAPEGSVVVAPPSPTEMPPADMPAKEIPPKVEDVVAGNDEDEVKDKEAEKEPVVPREVASEDDGEEAADSDIAHHRSCVKGRLSAPVAVDAGSVDRVVMNGKGNVDLGVVRNLILGNYHGHVSAVASEATVSNLKGKLNLSASKVISAKNIFNHSCISADKIGELSNFDHKLSVRAKEIELIANVKNKVVISGAVVKKLVNVAKGACLIDGAQVLEVVNSGPVGKCD